MQCAGETVKVPLVWEEAGRQSGHWYEADPSKQVPFIPIEDWSRATIDLPLHTCVELAMSRYIPTDKFLELSFARLPMNEMCTVRASIYAMRW